MNLIPLMIDNYCKQVTLRIYHVVCVVMPYHGTAEARQMLSSIVARVRIRLVLFSGDGRLCRTTQLSAAQPTLAWPTDHAVHTTYTLIIFGRRSALDCSTVRCAQ